MHPLGARLPSRVEVCLCINPIEPFLMVCLSPRVWACDQRMPVFNVEPARVAYVPICKRLYDVPECSSLCCGLANCSCTSWWEWDATVVATSTTSLCLIVHVVCEQCVVVCELLDSSSALALSALSISSTLSTLSSTSHVECIWHCGACVRHLHWDC